MYFRDEFEAAMHTPAWELFPYERSTIFVREPALAGGPSSAAGAAV
jgi:NADH-quinone oxidoreductase subunit F